MSASARIRKGRPPESSTPAKRASSQVWQSLSDAAETTDIDPSDSIHGPAAQRIVHHLAAAHDLRGLQRMLNEWDPIGVRSDLGGPGDEYSCLYSPLLERLAGGEDATEIALFLRTELEGHFGLNPSYSRPEAFASRLVDWFAEGAPA